ncbi:MAG TPA: hypothetical protein VK820_08095 [Steroidobacteraceae bacterium]|nr:hypothetical protein [Steroidobacteraceae bacterium]
MRLRFLWALAALPLAACTVPVRPAVQTPTHASSAELAAAIAADARKAEHESDPHIRAELARAARRDADTCIAAAPQAVACLFSRGVALGLEAREHPALAGAILNDMLATLARAETVDPAYDDAGPARVQALVWIRAPGWPLGPGDPERGLAAAERAAALRPEYPPNWLAVAEAQAKTGAAADARASYARARELATQLPDSPERAEWLNEAAQGLSHLR